MERQKAHFAGGSGESDDEKKQKLPRRWTEAKVRKVIAHYDKQTENEEAAEIEAARKDRNIMMMAVPTALVPRVRALLARKRSA